MTNPTLPNADELEVNWTFDGEFLCRNGRAVADMGGMGEEYGEHIASALSSAQAQIAELREALEQAQSNEDRLLKAINATDLSSEQKAFIADHLERSRPARAEAAEAEVKRLREAMERATAILDGELGSSWAERNEADFHIITDALSGGTSNG